jgi:hypothetical protein
LHNTKLVLTLTEPQKICHINSLLLQIAYNVRRFVKRTRFIKRLLCAVAKLS